MSGFTPPPLALRIGDSETSPLGEVVNREGYSGFDVGYEVPRHLRHGLICAFAGLSAMAIASWGVVIDPLRRCRRGDGIAGSGATGSIAAATATLRCCTLPLTVALRGQRSRRQKRSGLFLPARRPLARLWVPKVMRRLLLSGYLQSPAVPGLPDDRGWQGPDHGA